MNLIFQKLSTQEYTVMCLRRKWGHIQYITVEAVKIQEGAGGGQGKWEGARRASTDQKTCKTTSEALKIQRTKK